MTTMPFLENIYILLLNYLVENKGYYSYYMRKNNIRAEIKYSEEKKEVIIISYRVALIDDKKITIDDLERLF